MRTPFQGNIIPSNMIDPVGAKFLSYFPDPNVTGGGVSGMERNYLNEGLQHDMTAQWAGRLDLRLSEKHSLFGRFTVTDQPVRRCDNFGANSPAENDRDFRGDGGRQASFDWTAMLSPTTTWTLRAGFARFEETAGSARSKAFDPIAIGWPASLVNQFAGRHFPYVGYSFYQNMGADTVDSLNASNTYALQPSVGKVYRSHVMKFGGEVRDYQLNPLSFGLPSGQLSFPASWTQANPLQADAVSGDQIASQLLGWGGGQFAIPISPSYSYKYWVLYFQDDWKVTRKLSLNLGLRWDYESPPVERYNRMLRGYAFDQPSPIAAQVKAAPGVENCPACANLMGGPLFANVGGLPRTAFDPDRNNFQPRIGVAYALDSKTVFRGGYGLYYTAISAYEAGGNTGFSRTTPIITSPDGLVPNVRISNPLAGGTLLQPIGSSQGLSTNLGLGMGLNYIPRELGKSHMVSAGFQRELPFAFTIDASYVGNYSTGLPVSMGLNFIPASQLGQAASYYTAQVTNPFKGLLPNNSAMNGATISRSSLMVAYPHFPLSLSNVSIGKNRYDSMQLQARRRFGSGFTIQVNYQITKTLEQLSLLNAQDVNLTDYSKTVLDKRLTPFDVPQRLAVIGVYDLPVGKGRKIGSGMPYVLNLLVGGWTLGWNITHQSGFPVDFPNAAPLQARSAKLPSEQRNVFRWFDTSLFPKVAGPAPYTLRNFPTRFPDVRFMDLDTWDLNLSKDFPIVERLRGQIRVNAINAFNHPFMTQMASLGVTASNFGQLSISQGNPPRTINFDFRLVF
ncbi:MAG: TonB-dependent receptor [Acidobacteria bacterium]|nr:TonB-dependent receptor [Acidobacteriota bacterium]